MEQKDWKTIQELFNTLLDQPPEMRRSYLEEATAGDVSLHDEVLSLLESYNDHSGFLERPVIRITEGERYGEQEEMIGLEIGAYTIIGRIGRGGMGSVWLAERTEKEFDQQVAIKIVKRGMDSEEIIRRFRSERQILASLQHPNIARLIDGGIARDGRPWLGMEYVEGGTPLNRYADDHQLTIDQRLDLFSIVCAAVSYAHRNLIVHRDLKMTNILVSTEGKVTLLDFGIAKILSGNDDEEITGLGQHLLTPDYASPEQIRGEPVTTSTDVYSLGVLLYELLNGSRPHRLNGLSTAEMVETIQRTPPLSPTTTTGRYQGGKRASVADIARNRKTTPSRLARQLKGELETIVATAMQSDPRRRYQSVEQLADDIDRYHSGLPLRARRDSLPYLAGKFISRHRLGVGTAATLFTSITGFAVAMREQRNRIVEQSKQIGMERDRAEQIARFLKGLFSLNDPATARGEELTAREALDRGLERAEKELGDHPDLQVQILLMIGEVYLEMGLYDRAESIFRRSIQLAQQESLANSPETLASTLHALGATLTCRESNSEEAFDLFHQAFRILRSIGKDDPKSDPEGDLSHLLNDMGLILMRRGDATEAEGLFSIANEVRRHIFPGDHHHIAYTMSNLSLALQQQGSNRFSEAAELLSQSSDMLIRLYGEHHPDSAMGLYNLGRLYERLGRTEEAEALHIKVLGIRQKIYTSHRNLGHSYVRVGEILTNRGELEKAESHLQKALEMFRKIHGGDHPDVANALAGLGKYALKTGELDKAEELCRQAMEIVREQPSTMHVTTAGLHFLQASITYARGEGKEAEQGYRTVLQMLKSEKVQEAGVEERTSLALADLLIKKGEPKEAEQLLRNVLALREDRGDQRTGEVYDRLSQLRQRHDLHSDPQL